MIVHEYETIPSKFDRDMIYFAKSLALKSEVKGKHGSILVSPNGTIKSIGINYHNPMGHLGPKSSIHAEYAALNAFDNLEELTKHILYVARSTPSCLGHTFSKPCERCMKEIVKKKVGKVIYSNGGINEFYLPKVVVMEMKY